MQTDTHALGGVQSRDGPSPIMAQMSQVTMFSPRSLSVFMRQDYSSLGKPVFLLFYFHLLPSPHPISLPPPSIRHFTTMWAVRNVTTSNPKSRLLHHTSYLMYTILVSEETCARVEFNMAHLEQLTDFVNRLCACHFYMLSHSCGWF